MKESFVDICVQNAFDKYNINKDTVQEYDLLYTLVTHSTTRFLLSDPNFCIFTYVERLLKEKELLESDKEYYNENWLNCRSAKEESDFGIDDTKEKRILYIANMLSYFAEASKNFVGIEIGHPYNDILDRFLK